MASNTNVAYTAIRNWQRIAIQWFFYYRMFKYSLCKKINFSTFSVSIDDFLRDTLFCATAYLK